MSAVSLEVKPKVSDVKSEFGSVIPTRFKCPLTGNLMLEPVTAEDGLSYEREAIEKWFKDGKKTSPVTGQELDNFSLEPDISLQNAIAKFREKEKAKYKPALSKAEQHRKLFDAAKSGDLKEVNRLLSEEKVNVDADVKSTNGFTPLLAAVSAPDSQVFECLLEAKAKVSFYTAQWVALRSSWPSSQKQKILKKLAENGAKLLPIHEAATVNDIKSLSAELKKGQSKAQDSAKCYVLHYAAANGHTELLQRFIRTDAILVKWIKQKNEEALEAAIWLLENGGLSPNGVDTYGMTPLLYAAQMGHLKTVQWLLKEGGAKITDIDKNINSALLLAAQKGHLETVDWLLHNGASITDIDKNHNTALLLAALNGHLNVVKHLLDSKKVKITECDKDRNTAVLLAATQGHVGTVEWLLKSGGAKITETNTFGRTPLLLAAQAGREEMVKWLLTSGGAKISETDKGGNTALLLAAQAGRVEMVKWLLTNGGAKATETNKAGDTAYLLAARNGHAEILKCLSAIGGAEVRKTHKENDTPLLSAANNNRLEMVKHLLETGEAKVTEATEYGTTASLLAAQMGHLETLKWLLTNGGAKITEADKGGNTALLLAAENGHLETVKWLLTAGAKIGAADKESNTALLLAAKNGHLETVKWLLSAGAKIGEADKDGNTALLLAAQHGHLETVKWLLTAGKANITASNRGNETALSLALEGGYVETVKYLLKETSVRDKGFYSMDTLRWAMDEDRLEMLEVLLKEWGGRLEPEDQQQLMVRFWMDSSNPSLKLFQCLIGNRAFSSYTIHPDDDHSDDDHHSFKGQNSFSLAVRMNHLELLKWLYKYAADCFNPKRSASKEMGDENGDTPLLLAARYGRLEIVKWLLKEKIAKINDDEEDNNGDTPLFLAAKAGHVGVVEWLLTEGGAGLKDENRSGRTLVGLAMKKELPDKVLAFVEDFRTKLLKQVGFFSESSALSSPALLERKPRSPSP